MKKVFTSLAMMLMLAFTTQAAYYIVGNAPFGDWNPGAGVEMTQNTDGTYSYKATISGSVWFVFASGLDASWDVFNSNYRYGPSGSDVEVGVGQWTPTPQGGDKSYKFTGSGSEYVFTFNPFAMQFKIEGYVDPGALEITSYTVAGAPASVFGTEWDPANTANDKIKQADGKYMLQKFGCELAAGSNVEFKVAGNHAWGDAWPAENFVAPIEESGVYDLTFTIDPETKEVGFAMTQSGTIDVRTGDLFILGEVNGNGWDPSNGIKMTTEDGNIFTSTITTEGTNTDENDGKSYSFFSFTTKLGENAEDWASIGAYRIGSTEDGFILSEDMFGVDVPMGNFGQGNSFKVTAGTYDLTVNLDAKTMVINNHAKETTEAPVINIETTEDAVIISATGEGEVKLYVNGEEVENPYTVAMGEEEVTLEVTATAQGEGKEISEVATATVVVPAKAVEPANHYKLEKVWEINDLSFMAQNDVRQGFGMDGKFYINRKTYVADEEGNVTTEPDVLVIDQNGVTETTFPGGRNCGISRDEAGNLIISNAAFPNAWTEATIKVINPETGEVKEYLVPEECGVAGRSDFIGFAKGNLMEDGVLYLTGASTSGISVLTISGGEVNTDECYVATCDGLTASTSTVINYYQDVNGDEALLYVTRNAKPVKLMADGDNFAGTAFTLPGKGNTNGAFPFVWDGMELVIYPQSPDYQDGFAIAEPNAEEPIVTVPSTVASNGNGFQADWLNVEVDEDGVTIYQYYPGNTLGHITVYRLTKDQGGVEELINDNSKVVADKRYYNIMGQEMKEINGITIVVTTYTDGTRSAVKVIK